tara:strand:- start:246 stop:983 length:738 start_codon:yes stop_codon:yes gene_type:complete
MALKEKEAIIMGEARDPIRVLIPGLSLKIDAAGTGVIEPNSLGNYGGPMGNTYWVDRTPGGATATTALYSYDSFADITGLNHGEKTIFPLGYQISTWQNPSHTSIGAGATKACRIQMAWITSTESITTTIVDPDTLLAYLYSLSDDHSFNELVGYGWETWNTDTSLGTGATVPIEKDVFGALLPTATRRWTTRVYLWIDNDYVDSATTGFWEIAPSLINIPQRVVKESDLEYIMRLQRLANRSEF